MASAKQNNDGSWTIYFKIDTGSSVPSNLQIPTTFTYEGKSHTVTATTEEKSIDAPDWITPLGTLIDTKYISLSSESVKYGNAIYSVDDVKWTSVVPYGETDIVKKIVVTANNNEITCTGTTNCTAKYYEYDGDKVVKEEDLNVNNIVWNSANSAIATVSKGKVTGVNKTKYNKTVAISAIYNNVSGFVEITVKGDPNGTSEDSSGDGSGDVVIEPTGITLDKHTVDLNTYRNTAEFVYATITPSNATNKNVIWKSSNSSIAKVKSYKAPNRGWIEVPANNDLGTVTISACTYDEKYFDTCKVTVSPDGTIVTAVTPTTVTIPAESSTRTFHVEYIDLNGHHTGYGVTGIEDAKKTQDGNTLTVTFATNYGNKLEKTVWIRGYFSNDKGVAVKIVQEAADYIKSFHNYTKSVCDANGTFYYTNNFNTGLGGIEFTCGAGCGRTVLSQVQVDSSWLTVETSKFQVISTNTWTSDQLMEYEMTGKIDGVVPMRPSGEPWFNGYTLRYYVPIKVQKNTTGKARDAKITFPDNMVYKVHQDA